MSKLLIRPQKRPLSGTISVPGDKSISHRAVLLASLADGLSVVRDWLPAGDTLKTLYAIQSLGVHLKIEKKTNQRWNLEIEGRGLHGFHPPEAAIDCGNAGTCMRLLAGILAAQPFQSILDGSEQLRQRPMKRIISPLRQMGAVIIAPDGRAPLAFQPGQLNGIDYHLPVASAQVKSAVLLAGLYASSTTRIYEPGPARDHTERMLQAMGVELTRTGGWIGISRLPTSLNPLELTIPGDISSAAFPLVASVIVPHSKITIRGVGFNETRIGLIDILKAMGAQFKELNIRTTGGEPVADLTIQFDELHSTEIDGDLVVRAIDEFPIWAIAATQAAGNSSVGEAAELRVKEVDRIELLTVELMKMKAQVEERADGFSISGPIRLHGADVDSHGDHRLAMALAVAGLIAAGPTIVHNAACIHDSYPDFVETMRTLGADMEWVP
jgi:3-phosphoshikimate 1-carboxyvinyltransferase